MSAFVVEDKTINRVVTFLTTARHLDFIRRRLQSQGIDLDYEQARRDLACAMFELNIKAVDERYGEGEAEKFRDKPFGLKARNVKLNFQYHPCFETNEFQCFKSLSCWLYQCSEGDIPETSTLYKTMREIEGAWAKVIVCNLPAYDKALWN